MKGGFRGSIAFSFFLLIILAGCVADKPVSAGTKPCCIAVWDAVSSKMMNCAVGAGDVFLTRLHNGRIIHYISFRQTHAALLNNEHARGCTCKFIAQIIPIHKTVSEVQI